MVCVGLWLGHPRHGFDYQNEAAITKQLEQCLEVVRKYKDHPAVLLWGIGNEMEEDGRNPAIWYAIDHIAREIQEQPHTIAIDAAGRVFVGDRSNYRIQVFDQDGTYITEWGMKGSGPDQISEPHTIAMDSKGRLFVGDREKCIAAKRIAPPLHADFAEHGF